MMLLRLRSPLFHAGLVAFPQDRVHECNEDYLRFLTSMAWLCRSEDLSSRRSATPAASATPITAMGEEAFLCYLVPAC